MTRKEKINYLKALQSGDQTIMKQIQDEKYEQYFKSLSSAELQVIIDCSEIFSDFSISSLQKVFDKYRLEIVKYMKYKETPVGIASRFIVIDNALCFRFDKGMINFKIGKMWNDYNTRGLANLEYYNQNKEYIDSMSV